MLNADFIVIVVRIFTTLSSAGCVITETTNETVFLNSLYHVLLYQFSGVVYFETFFHFFSA